MEKFVLLDCERTKYPKSGIANVCRSLIRGLSEIKSNFKVELYGPESSLKEYSQNQTIIPWKFWQKYFPVSTKKYELIHVTHQLSDYFHGIKKNQKKIVTLHDLNFLHEELSQQKKNKRIKLIQKNIGNASAIVCISEFAKDDFLKNIHLFELKKDVLIDSVYNGLIFPELSEYYSEKLQYMKKKKYILNIGVLFPKKNQLVLLDFLAQTDLDLVLVSSSFKTEYREKFLERIKDLKLENRVHILQDVEDADKNFLLQNCESYIHPSLAEGFGIPPVEAMYFGKPVFLSNKTSLPEIGGDVAYYFDNFSPEKMLETYKNGMQNYCSEIEVCREKLHLRALNFGAKKMAENYLAIYEKVLQNIDK